MKPRQQRMLAVGLTVAGIAIAALLTLQAFKENMMFFVEISEVEKGNYPDDRNFRVGGLVVEGSVQRAPGDLTVAFDLTDLTSKLTVNYAGILPDLFREGQGIVAHGRLNDSGTFIADEVLAKHDENYMPPEVADSLAKAAAAQEAISKQDEK
ncbi:MAG: cytochrome c maturation protein CcmE [Woeseia sp.]|jgi:cytochrome c-type biogenesis protein CcmE|nr:cytochrome c maturation protein CcmE [Woeseia sp.]